MKYEYSFEINYRVRRESSREQKLLELAKEYHLEPGCRLIDRIVEDRHLISQERARQMVEALELEKQAKLMKQRLAAGE